MKKTLLLLLLVLTGCSTTQLVNNWKNPETALFHANKVLIVGMAPSEEARVAFESKMQKEFEKRGVESVQSLDLFDVEFTASARSDEEILRVEQQLLDKDFDAILFNKVVGSQDKETFRRKIKGMNQLFQTFSDDYKGHQDIYYDEDYYDGFTVYHAETSLFCICVDKEMELIWRGAIDITDPSNIEKTIDDYIKLVVLAMEEQDLIFYKDLNDEASAL
ncbi:hypothetical protein [Ulvibacterium sp.]|uniref:hypothetical protein n=1 Tax=Ulvibacterium sp. TaxID=2665914 RepID=UPI00262ABDEC|nr:hypothetical protein [Ulvibacterium sp.]